MRDKKGREEKLSAWCAAVCERAVEEEHACGSPLLMLVQQMEEPPYKEVQLSII
jgi:hypothetical protein